VRIETTSHLSWRLLVAIYCEGFPAETTAKTNGTRPRHTTAAALTDSRHKPPKSRPARPAPRAPGSAGPIVAAKPGIADSELVGNPHCRGLRDGARPADADAWRRRASICDRTSGVQPLKTNNLVRERPVFPPAGKRLVGDVARRTWL